MCAHLANMIIPIWLEGSNTSISSARSNKKWQPRADYKVQNWTVVMNCYDNWFLSFSLTFGWVLTGGWLSLLAHSPFGWVPCKVLSAWVGSHVPWGSPGSKVLFSAVNLKEELSVGLIWLINSRNCRLKDLMTNLTVVFCPFWSLTVLYLGSVSSVNKLWQHP